MGTGSNHHDALFRSTFSHPEHAAAELRAILPKVLFDKIDLSTLQLVSGTFVDAELASSQSDLLFSVKIQERPALLYFLFEHQSTVEELMAFRVLKYEVRILDRHIADAGGGKEALPLPVIIPIVLHHSAKGWTATTRMFDLFDAGLMAEPLIVRSVPQLEFFLDDISQVDDDELARRALGLLPTLTLWALRDARQPRAIQQSIVRWAGAMRALLTAETGREALFSIFRYLSLVVDDPQSQTLLTTLASGDAKEPLMTTLAEKWLAEGQAKGLAEGQAKGLAEGQAKGLAEGQAKGRVEGERAILLHILTTKFGRLSPAAIARIEVASEQNVLLWTTRALSAESVASVLED